MKYYSAIFFLLLLSFFSVISLLFIGNSTREIERENNILREKINLTSDQININEIEYSLFNSYGYLEKLNKIYFKEHEKDFINNRISFNDFENSNLENLFTVGIR